MLRLSAMDTLNISQILIEAYPNPHSNRRKNLKFWYIGKGNGFRLLNELRKTMGHERIQFEQKDATHFYFKWVEVEVLHVGFGP